MGYTYMTTSGLVREGKTKLTSFIINGNAGQYSATCTFYNSNTATASTEFMKLAIGTAPDTLVWSDEIGINLDNLFVALFCANATFIWD